MSKGVPHKSARRRHTERLAARCDDVRRRVCTHQRLSGQGRSLDNMLAIVEHEQHLFSAQRIRDALGCNGTSGEFQSNRRANGHGTKLEL